MAILFGDSSTQARAAKVLKVHRFEWNTRTGISRSSGTSTLWFYENSFTKLESTSTIIIHGFFPGWSNNDGACQGVVYIGNQNEESGSGYNYTSSGYLKHWLVNVAIANNTQTGSINFGIGFRHNNGVAGSPFDSVWNPNSTEDGRLSQTGAIILVEEVMP